MLFLEMIIFVFRMVLKMLFLGMILFVFGNVFRNDFICLSSY